MQTFAIHAHRKRWHVFKTNKSTSSLSIFGEVGDIFISNDLSHSIATFVYLKLCFAILCERAVNADDPCSCMQLLACFIAHWLSSPDWQHQNNGTCLVWKGHSTKKKKKRRVVGKKNQTFSQLERTSIGLKLIRWIDRKKRGQRDASAAACLLDVWGDSKLIYQSEQTEGLKDHWTVEFACLQQNMHEPNYVSLLEDGLIKQWYCIRIKIMHNLQLQVEYSWPPEGSS